MKLQLPWYQAKIKWYLSTYPGQQWRPHHRWFVTKRSPKCLPQAAAGPRITRFLLRFNWEGGNTVEPSLYYWSLSGSVLLSSFRTCHYLAFHPAYRLEQWVGWDNCLRWLACYLLLLGTSTCFCKNHFKTLSIPLSISQGGSLIWL